MFAVARAHPVGRWFLAFALAVALYVGACAWTVATTPSLRTGVAQLATSWWNREVKCFVLQLRTLGQAHHCGGDS